MLVGCLELLFEARTRLRAFARVLDRTGAADPFEALPLEAFIAAPRPALLYPITPALRLRYDGAPRLAGPERLRAPIRRAASARAAATEAARAACEEVLRFLHEHTGAFAPSQTPSEPPAVYRLRLALTPYDEAAERLAAAATREERAALVALAAAVGMEAVWDGFSQRWSVGEAGAGGPPWWEEELG